MYYDEHFGKFDDNIENNESIPIKNYNSVNLSYIKYKKVMALESRDFILKGFRF